MLLQFALDHPFCAVRIADGLLLASFGLTLFFGAILPDACLAFRRIVFWNWQLALPPDGRHLVTTTGQYY